MSMTDTYTEMDSGAALTASAAVVRCLPATDLVPGAPGIGAAAISTAIPGAGARAVTANLSGAVSGALVLVLSAELSTTVENGPVGPQELVAGLDPALTDATAALGGTYGELRFEAPQALDAEVALANAAAFDSVVVVPLTQGGATIASLVLLMQHTADLPATTGESASFEPLAGGIETGAVRAVELLNDVEMGVTAELGRTRMTVRELLSMQPGSIVELDRAAGSPVDLLVNGTLVARGEVVVIDEEFGVRITEIIGYDQKKNG